MRFLILSCSLAGESQSNAAALRLRALAEARGAQVTFIDANQMLTQMALLDGPPSEDCLPPEMGELDRYAAIIFCTPIYHNAVSGFAKLVLDHLGTLLSGKLVGIVTSGGSERSTLAAMSLTTPLIHGCGAMVLTQAVHISPGCDNQEIDLRLQALLDEASKLSQLLGSGLSDRIVSARLPTDAGDFTLSCFIDQDDNREHLALWHRSAAEFSDPLLRIHSECLTGDIFGSRRCDCGEQLSGALRLIGDASEGIVIYLRQEGRGIGLPAKLAAYNLQDQGLDTIEANERLGYHADARDFGAAIAILRHLGVNSVRLITNNPAKIEALAKGGIKVTERIPAVASVHSDNARYLQTKLAKMGHLLPQIA